MRVLVSTPAFGGHVYDRYMASLLYARDMALNEGLADEISIHGGNDSLIHRARNRAAMYLLNNGYDRLISIDADIVFRYEDFKRLLVSPHSIVGGAYPLKAFPVVMNFNPLPGHGDELVTTERGIDYAAWEKFTHKYAEGDGTARVRHLATGFLSVRREVFETLAKTAEWYGSRDPVNNQVERCYHFYPSQVLNHNLLSEDWFFCHNASGAGYDLRLDTRISLGHIGNHTFRIGQVFGEVQV